MLRKLLFSSTLAVAATGLIVAAVPRAIASATPTVSEISLPANSDPWGTAFDANGKVWVALPGCDFSPHCSSTTPPGKLALVDPATQGVTTVALPTGTSPKWGQPIFVAVDPRGAVWFTMPNTNRIGRYDPASQSFSQWTVPTPNAGPWGIAIEAPNVHNEKIWFTEHFGHKIGWFNPRTEQFHELATPTANSDPYGITLDASNNVWFTENNPSVAQIGEYSTDLDVFNEYKIRNTPPGDEALTPHLITSDPATGNVWWTEGFVGGVGVLNVASAQPGTKNGVTEYIYCPFDYCGHTSGISIHSGQVWLDDSLKNVFGSISTAGGSFSFTTVPTANAHPHDGLNVDSNGHVWFDEEFGNKLAEATP